MSVLWFGRRNRPIKPRTGRRNLSESAFDRGDNNVKKVRAFPRTAAIGSIGYEWDIASFDRSILAEGDHEYVPDTSSSNPLVGAGGTFIFRFTAVASGRTPLTLIYHRSWETVPPLDTFAADVVVQ
jgi:predicted secreted protein